MCAFVVELGLVFSIPSQEIGLGKRLRNDLFCVEWDVKPPLSSVMVVFIVVIVTVYWQYASIIESHPHMLMSLSIHLHCLHLDTIYCQIWHPSTQLRCGERTGRRLLRWTTLLLPTLLSDSQVFISLVIHGLWWTVAGQGKAHIILTCINWVSPNHLPVIVASDRPWTTLSTRAH